MKIQLKFEKRDCWVGVYWNSSWSVLGYGNRPPNFYKKTKKGRWGREFLKIYICLIPCFPIIITLDK